MRSAHQVIVCFVCFLLVAQNVQSQQKATELTLRDFHFQGIEGYRTSNGYEVYYLLGNSFYRTPTAKNTDSLIGKWINDHPDAQVIVVSTLYDTFGEKPGMTYTYCLLVDKKDTLNSNLVRNGCVSGSTMIRPKTEAELTAAEKKIYGSYMLTVFMGKSAYDTYTSQIGHAEAYAHAHKLGIWKKGK